jgi:ribosome maturation factor RimP
MNWLKAVEQTVSGLGYDLVETERAPRGLLRVYIDRLPGAMGGEFITVEDCERVTRQLQHVLEVEACAYERLEVSSPGLDRPLKTVAHYQRFQGAEVEITLAQAFEGRKKFKGVLCRPPGLDGAEEVPASSWRLVFVEGKLEKALDFELAEVREARLVPVVDFKGRRFAAPAEDVPPAETSGSAGEQDGG